jgi:uncharacterized membrane protein YccC
VSLRPAIQPGRCVGCAAGCGARRLRRQRDGAGPSGGALRHRTAVARGVLTRQAVAPLELTPYLKLRMLDFTAVRKKWRAIESSGTGWPVVVHSARTAVATAASVLVARLFRLPETYWAAITTLVITQSSLGAALTVSWQRFVGTALGAVVGAIVASHFGPHVLVFGTSVFILGLLCAVARLDRDAYRFGAVTLAIVLLVLRTGPAWQIAFHRFAEVSIGIGVALILAVVWPEREVTPSGGEVCR